MTDEQTIAKLYKTLTTINNYIDRGGRLGSTVRGWELVRRYDDLRDAVTGDRGYTPAWVAYCDSIKAAPSHTGVDQFA